MFLMAVVLMIMVVECQGQDINHGIMVWHHTRSPRCKSFGECWWHGHAGIDHDHDYYV